MLQAEKESLQHYILAAERANNPKALSASSSPTRGTAVSPVREPNGSVRSGGGRSHSLLQEDRPLLCHTAEAVNAEERTVLLPDGDASKC